MNDRQRFLECVRFGSPDRLPYRPQGFWRATRARWHEEGLPRNVNLNEFFGFDDWRYLPVNVKMLPGFEEDVLEDQGEFEIVRTQNGVVKRILKDNPELSMPEWIDFPVKSASDFAAIRSHYDPAAPGRYPADWNSRVEEWNNRDYVLGVDLYNGLYMTLREWLGPEALLYAFFDTPDLIHEMLEFYTDFLIATLKRAFSDVDVDYLSLSEDIAFKNGPFLSPSQFAEFFVPCYRRLAEFVRGHGVDVLMIDSDGNAQALIPGLLEAGFNGVHPCEVAAGNNVVDLRKEYGEDLILWCGIDKRALAQGKDAIRREVEAKLPYMIEAGGYIPHIDHTVPPDVPFEAFCYYQDLLKSYE